MEDVKEWYLSKTVWGALIAIFASLVPLAGWQVDSGVQSQLADDLVSLAGAIGGLVAIYGRLTAEKRLS